MKKKGIFVLQFYFNFCFVNIVSSVRKYLCRKQDVRRHISKMRNAVTNYYFINRGYNLKTVLNSVVVLFLICLIYSCKKSKPINSSNTACVQGWSLKNLDVSTYRNGDPIPHVTSALAWPNLTTGAWCWYNNDSATYAVYGKLYNWYAVNDPRGLAPANWHVATDSEWNLMEKCLDNTVDTTFIGWSGTTVGGSLKDLFRWASPNTAAGNNIGFSALPSGYRLFSDGIFYEVGRLGGWWTANEYNTAFALDRAMYYANSKIYRDKKNKVDGFSVRVVRD
jgi:uncharacterized protein (TIGR02145 family)